MNKNGIALIMAVGVLALLAIIATSFALNMRLEYHAAMNYYSGVKARYFAEAALQRAIAELRSHVKSSAFDDSNEVWAKDGYKNDGAASGVPNITANITSNGTSFTTHIYDEQRKININTASADLLSNLVSRVFPSWSNGAVNTFVANITGHVPCNNLNELMMNTSSSGSDNHIEKTDLDTLRPFITVNSYRDPNCGNRAPININTCSQAALESIFEGLRGSVGAAVKAGEAASIASAVISARSITPITSWSGFDSIIDAVSAITAAQQTAVKDNCNPNRTKPLPSTTEFCFNSGGYYTVTATGSVTGALSAPIASNTLSAVVKVYDIYCETTKAQFEKGNEDKNYNNVLDAGEDTNGNGVLDVPVRVTWIDSCPVDSIALFDTYTTSFTDSMKRPDSIKLGYWDDFSDTIYTQSMWTKASGTCNISGGLLSLSSWGKYVLTDPDYANLGRFSFRAHENTTPSTDMKDVAWILFWGTGALINDGSAIGALHAKSGLLSWSGYAYNDYAKGTGYVRFPTDKQIADDGLQNSDRHLYSGQVRMFVADTDVSHDLDAYRTSLAYENEKIDTIIAKAGSAILSIYTSSNSKSLIRTGIANRSGGTSGKLGLYVQACSATFDDIRIISPDGNFTSQVINSTLSPGMTGNVAWGTITGTVTIPSGASAASEKITFQTKSNTDSIAWEDACPITGAIGSIAGSSIQYKALLTTADPNMKKTPVLEDITITYLPKVSIKSFLLSN